MSPVPLPVQRHYLALKVANGAGLSQSTSTQLHLRLAGERHQPMLVLLHQAPSHSAMFEPLMQQLAASYFCVAPDLPGCGQSDALCVDGVEQPLSIGEIAGCLATSLQPLGPVAAILGHHTGAAVAAEMAACWLPQLKAAILSGPPLLDASLRQQLQSMQQPLPATPNGSHLQLLWQYLHAKDPELPLAITEREFAAALLLGPGYRSLYQAVAAHDFAGCLTRISCPTLLMAGQQDTLYPALAPALALLPHGQSLDLGLSGTYVFERQTKQVGSAIRHFLQSIGV